MILVFVNILQCGPSLVRAGSFSSFSISSFSQFPCEDALRRLLSPSELIEVLSKIAAIAFGQFVPPLSLYSAPESWTINFPGNLFAP